MPAYAKGLEKAAGLVAKGYDYSAEELGKLGQFFQELAARTPDYFATSKELPKGLNDEAALEMLSKKHGVPLKKQNVDIQDWTGAQLRAPNDVVTGPFDMVMEPTGPLSRYEGLRALQGRGSVSDKLSPDTQLFAINTSGAPVGRGVAKQAYPAFYEYLLSRPNAANVPEELSHNNRFRRNSNMVGMVEKYGDAAGNRLIAHEGQLGPYDTGRDVAYHALPTDAKIGVLNSLGAARTQSVMDEYLKRLNFLAADAHLGASTAYQRKSADEMVREARALGMEPGGQWAPSTDVDPQHFQRTSDLVQRISRATGNAQVVGLDSLRRAAITNDALNQGLAPSDLDLQWFLTKHLARKEGGSVPARTPGPLTQTCSCGAK